MATKVSKTAQTKYQERFERHLAELKWLYMELYHNEWMFDELCKNLYAYFAERSFSLRRLDERREKNPFWFQQNDRIGMKLYVDKFAGTLKGVMEKLDYIQKCNVNHLHLMSFGDSASEKPDQGPALIDYRRVRPDLGTVEDLAALAEECHRRGITLCTDFVMNHTSSDHEWAKRAREGDGEYMSRYFFFDNYSMPAMYEKTVPQVHPTAAPGNFTYLSDIRYFVMTTFYPCQWDLNYQNPRVFNEMMYHFLYLANQGLDVICIDDLSFIWKQIGTSCRNLPQVHSLVRIMRMIGEIVCPGVLLLGNGITDPGQASSYFGSKEKPECHLLYDDSNMAVTWNSVATQDVRLLKQHMDAVNRLSSQCTFLNYLRSQDAVRWILDYSALKGWGMEEAPHRQFLNDFFTGKALGSFSRGELYNCDPLAGEDQFCGTVASMCGIEKAGFENEEQDMEEAMRRYLMLHAFLFTQAGIPLLYSGQEFGQLNDYSYKTKPEIAPDAQNVHKGPFPWDLADNIENENSEQAVLFTRLSQLEAVRKTEKVFSAKAQLSTLDTYDNGILCLVRTLDREKLIGLFNFSNTERVAWIDEEDGLYTDLLTKETMKASGLHMNPNSFLWLKRKNARKKPSKNTGKEA